LNVIADTSFLVSLTNPLEQQHENCVNVARNLRQKIVVPITVLPEATYFIARRLSHRSMRAFVKQFQSPHWHIENLSLDDLERSQQILTQYSDARLDFVDATIVALAERLDIHTVLTLDQRDFRIIRPGHTDYFTILP
jgi:predicted nucleic acid-binding protein